MRCSGTYTLSNFSSSAFFASLSPPRFSLLFSSLTVFPHITDAFAAPPLVPTIRYMGPNWDSDAFTSTFKLNYQSGCAYPCQRCTLSFWPTFSSWQHPFTSSSLACRPGQKKTNKLTHAKASKVLETAYSGYHLLPKFLFQMQLVIYYSYWPMFWYCAHCYGVVRLHMLTKLDLHSKLAPKCAASVQLEELASV